MAEALYQDGAQAWRVMCSAYPVRSECFELGTTHVGVGGFGGVTLVDGYVGAEEVAARESSRRCAVWMPCSKS